MEENKKKTNILKNRKRLIVIIVLVVTAIAGIVLISQPDPIIKSKTTSDVEQRAEKNGYKVETSQKHDFGPGVGEATHTCISIPGDLSGKVNALQFETKEIAMDYIVKLAKEYAEYNNLPDPEDDLRKKGVFIGTNDEFYYIAAVNGNLIAFTTIGNDEETINMAKEYMRNLGFKVK